MNPQPASTLSPEVWAHRAAAAQKHVDFSFGHRLMGLPGTWLGYSAIGKNHRLQWNYWWQAHYLDCALDALERQQLSGETPDFSRVKAILRGIRLHNYGTVINSFYDDMAWLALAVARLRKYHQEIIGRDYLSARLTQNTLNRQLRSAWSQELGGGLYWNRSRDFKNTPVNGPASLFFARTGDTLRAQSLATWLQENLWDAQQQLYLDGIHLRDSTPEVEATIWSYNQGPILGALLELNEHESLNHATEIITGVEQQLSERGMLHLHGGGDSGLFTGILARYLAQAACTSTLSHEARIKASTLVLRTAQQLWETRSQYGAFSQEITTPADEYFAHTKVELSGQLQAWMILEAAHRITYAS